jgi:hypothetical protein
MCNNRSSFKSFNKLQQSILIELGDDNTVSVTHPGHVDATQGYKIDALHTPTLHFLLFWINELESAGTSATCGSSKYSKLLTQ